MPADAAAESIIFASASKAFNLPGLKASLVVAGGDQAWARLAEMPIEVTFGTGLPGVMAGDVAFRACDDWLAALVRGLDHNRHLLAELLAERLPEVRYVPPQATYLAWLDLRALDLGDDPAEPLLERGRVALASGPTFGTARQEPRPAQLRYFADHLDRGRTADGCHARLASESRGQSGCS